MNNGYQHVVFEPWIGDNYKALPIVGKPVLLLGWSHRALWQSSGRLGSKDTIGFVEGHIEDGDDTPRQFWAKARQAVTGGERTASAEERHAFWHSVSFYNYIQEPLQDASQTPSLKQYEGARLAFLEVLREHQPKRIIVLGETLWRKMPYDGHAGPPIDCCGVKRETWHYPIGANAFAVASRIDHPSVRRKWNPSDWHRWVLAALSQSDKERECPGCSAAQRIGQSVA
jgi:hypothetical protein